MSTHTIRPTHHVSPKSLLIGLVGTAHQRKEPAMSLHTRKPTRMAAVTAATMTMAVLGVVVPAGAPAAEEPDYDTTLPCFLQTTPEEKRSCLLHTSPGYVDKLLGDGYPSATR
jgi:hypothetical protein